jgi:uncharacterized membrane protein YbaN (DUF454 family)
MIAQISLITSIFYELDLPTVRISILQLQSRLQRGANKEAHPSPFLIPICYFCSLKAVNHLAPVKTSILPKPLWVALGFFFTGIGIIGYILPLMPGLVFFILAAFCFAKGSRKFLRALLSNRFVGPAIMDWKRGRGMTLKSKIIALATVMPSMAFSAFYIVHVEWVRWCILGCAVLVAVIIISVKTKRSKIN